MRIRTIKPDFYRHEGLFEAEQAAKLPLRVAFSGLWGCCDREGRFKWRPKQLKLDILPYDLLDFENVLEALCQYGFVVKYQAGLEYYGYVPTFKTHQIINQREAASRLPPPPDMETHVGKGKGIGKELLQQPKNYLRRMNPPSPLRPPRRVVVVLRQAKKAEKARSRQNFPAPARTRQNARPRPIATWPKARWPRKR